ncbi:MAG: NifU family protein, partial [Oligoflexia bacterium]|nr:NifU family protein [Oligoflexia bacterium]
ITVTKEDWLEWDMIAHPLLELIQDHLNKGEKALLPKQAEQEQSKQDNCQSVQKIKEVLETDIQPAVAMDGGYIEFISYENGIVYLSLQGACSGCPSSTLTLKQGIESRLKQFVPDIKEVVEV